LKSWIELDEERLLGNFNVLAKAAGGAAVLPVVKANAYGHGLEQCARVLAQAGAEWLGVTGVEEGTRVRRLLAESGIAADAQPRVLVMCGISQEDAQTVVAERLTPVVWSVEQVGWLVAALEQQSRGGSLRVHVEVDSGMSRQGAKPGDELQSVLEAIEGANGLRLDGVMTHFADAEVAGSEQSASQRKSFEAALQQVWAAGVVPGWLSVGNTSGIDLMDRSEDFLAWMKRLAAGMGARGLVRTGLALFGYRLALQGDAPVASRLQGKVLPVMTWKAKIIGVADVPAGSAVGYNGTFAAEQPMRLALVAAGYADGLRRELSSTNTKAGGWMMVRGQRAAIVGRISMNLTTVDVTDIADVKVGDVAVLLGEGITAEDHALIAGTIAYEIVCGVR
jgi:alanine racemase